MLQRLHGANRTTENFRSFRQSQPGDQAEVQHLTLAFGEGPKQLIDVVGRESFDRFGLDVAPGEVMTHRVERCHNVRPPHPLAMFVDQ